MEGTHRGPDAGYVVVHGGRHGISPSGTPLLSSFRANAGHSDGFVIKLDVGVDPQVKYSREEGDPLLQILNPVAAVAGVPRENMFQAVDDSGLKCGTATVVEFVNQILVPERPLNYYITINAMNERAFDMLMGAAIARAMELRRKQPNMPARIYTPCRPNDMPHLQRLESFGFLCDDEIMKIRRVLSESDRVPGPPVGCTIAPVILEEESDLIGLLERINRYSLTQRSLEWLMRLQQEEQYFKVLGMWDDNDVLGELILTAYGSESRIEMLYTDEAYQQRGIATALIAHAGDMMLQNGIRLITAEIWKRNIRCMSLFHGLQFDIVSPVILYPGINIG